MVNVVVARDRLVAARAELEAVERAEEFERAGRRMAALRELMRVNEDTLRVVAELGDAVSQLEHDPTTRSVLGPWATPLFAAAGRVRQVLDGSRP